MNIQEYYNIIRTKIENNNFKVRIYNQDLLEQINNNKSNIRCFKQDKITNSHLEAIHYLMYEFWLDRNDPRIPTVFDYVCLPRGVNIKGGTDIDFTQWDTESFIKEIMTLKD